MATITTTIREPKTFQQIQDQQNELGKNQTLESLNDNISKLIKAITDRDQKRETEQDRQLKMNQLELSKLQLRRAQLGLAKDEKYYQEYSNKWQTKNDFGTSIGLDHGTSSNIGAIGVSALTAGALNPVIVKNLLFPIMTPLMNVTKALATFPGLLPGLFHRTSGKSSSAVASDPDRRLHGKLDQILGAIKDKTKSSKAKEEKEQSMLSKFLNALLLGASGMFVASEMLGGGEGVVMQTLKDYGPAMIAGFALGGWKGALVGLGIQLGAEALGIIKTDSKETPNIITDALRAVNGFIEPIFGFELEEDEFKGIAAGLMLGGVKGAVLGYAIIKAANVFGLVKNDDDSKRNGFDTNDKETFATKLSKKLGFTLSKENITWTAAGLMFGGVKGAALGLAASIIKNTFFDGITKDDEVKKGNVPTSDKTSLQDMLKSKGINLSDDQIKAAAAGAMLFGWRGAIAGVLLASDTAKKVIPLLLSGDFTEAAEQISNSVGNLLEGTVLEGISDKVITGALAGAAMGLKGGVKGIIVGALLGGAGGFVWERIKSKELAEKYGFETTFDGLIGNSGKTWDYFEKQTRKQLELAKDENGNRIYSDEYINENIEKETVNLIKNLIDDEKIKNEEQSLSDRIFDHIEEHPKLDAAIAAYGAYKLAPVAKKTVKTGSKVVNVMKSAAPAAKSAAKLAGKVAMPATVALEVGSDIYEIANSDEPSEIAAQRLLDERRENGFESGWDYINPYKYGQQFALVIGVDKAVQYAVDKLYPTSKPKIKERITNPEIQNEIEKRVKSEESQKEQLVDETNALTKVMQDNIDGNKQQTNAITSAIENSANLQTSGITLQDSSPVNTGWN